jgi:hypothetical protein
MKMIYILNGRMLMWEPSISRALGSISDITPALVLVTHTHTHTHTERYIYQRVIKTDAGGSLGLPVVHCLNVSCINFGPMIVKPLTFVVSFLISILLFGHIAVIEGGSRGLSHLRLPAPITATCPCKFRYA